VAVTRAVDFALNDDTVFTVVTMDKHSQDRCNEEKDNVPD
jgi:hypothetical protein